MRNLGCALLIIFLTIFCDIYPVCAESKRQNTLCAITLDSLINSWLKRPDLVHSLIGIEVMQLPTGTVLYSLQGDKRFAPASTTKLLTTACAYDILGGAFQYKTRLYAQGQTNGQVLNGDIVIQPSEDPSLKQDDLRRLIMQIQKKGIKKITGSLAIVEIPGGHDRFQPEWLLEDWGQEWMPPSSDLVIDRNITAGNFAFNGYKKVNTEHETAPSSLTATLLSAGLAASWVECDPKLKELHYYRDSAINATAPAVVANPGLFNQALAQDMARNMQLHIDDSLASKVWHFLPGSKSQRQAILISEIQSKPLASIIEKTLHESDNLYAQQLLRTLGLPQLNPEFKTDSHIGLVKSKGDSATLESRGLEKLYGWLAKAGVSSSEVVLVDGCGLSRKDGIAPHALNMVLKYMWNTNPVYIELLKHSNPLGGSKGGFCFKTGAMDTVRCITGILQTAGAQTLAVTIMVNGHVQSVQALRGDVDSLVALLDSIKSVKIVPAPAPPSAAQPASRKTYVELQHAIAKAPASPSRHRHSRHTRRAQ